MEDNLISSSWEFITPPHTPLTTFRKHPHHHVSMPVSPTSAKAAKRLGRVMMRISCPPPSSSSSTCRDGYGVDASPTIPHFSIVDVQNVFADEKNKPSTSAPIQTSDDSGSSDRRNSGDEDSSSSHSSSSSFSSSSRSPTLRRKRRPNPIPLPSITTTSYDDIYPELGHADDEDSGSGSSSGDGDSPTTPHAITSPPPSLNVDSLLSASASRRSSLSSLSSSLLLSLEEDDPSQTEILTGVMSSAVVPQVIPAPNKLGMGIGFASPLEYILEDLEFHSPISPVVGGSASLMMDETMKTTRHRSWSVSSTTSIASQSSTSTSSSTAEPATPTAPISISSSSPPSLPISSPSSAPPSSTSSFLKLTRRRSDSANSITRSHSRSHSESASSTRAIRAGNTGKRVSFVDWDGDTLCDDGSRRESRVVSPTPSSTSSTSTTSASTAVHTIPSANASFESIYNRHFAPSSRSSSSSSKKTLFASFFHHKPHHHTPPPTTNPHTLSRQSTTTTAISTTTHTRTLHRSQSSTALLQLPAPWQPPSYASILNPSPLNPNPTTPPPTHHNHHRRVLHRQPSTLSISISSPPPPSYEEVTQTPSGEILLEEGTYVDGVLLDKYNEKEMWDMLEKLRRL